MTNEEHRNFRKSVKRNQWDANNVAKDKLEEMGVLNNALEMLNESQDAYQKARADMLKTGYYQE